MSLGDCCGGEPFCACTVSICSQFKNEETETEPFGSESALVVVEFLTPMASGVLGSSDLGVLSYVRMFLGFIIERVVILFQSPMTDLITGTLMFGFTPCWYNCTVQWLLEDFTWFMPDASLLVGAAPVMKNGFGIASSLSTES